MSAFFGYWRRKEAKVFSESRFIADDGFLYRNTRNSWMHTDTFLEWLVGFDSYVGKNLKSWSGSTAWQRKFLWSCRYNTRAAPRESYFSSCTMHLAIAASRYWDNIWYETKVPQHSTEASYRFNRREGHKQLTHNWPLHVHDSYVRYLIKDGWAHHLKLCCVPIRGSRWLMVVSGIFSN